MNHNLSSLELRTISLLDTALSISELSDKAGLRVDDKILKIGEFNLQNKPQQIVAAVQMTHSSKGIPIKFIISRDGDKKEIDITVPKEPDTDKAFRSLDSSENEEPPKAKIAEFTYGASAEKEKLEFKEAVKKGIKTIVHEIVHLMVEENIQKYKLEHFEKERLVDLILNSEKFSFLQYNSWQKDYHGAEKYVDDLFNEHFFESQEKFFDEMENTRKKYPEIK